MNTVGRNEPCPCGSGKKYKKCCLAAAEAERFAFSQVYSARDGFQSRFMEYAMKRENREKVTEEFTEATGLAMEDQHLPLFIRWLAARKTESGTRFSDFRESAALEDMESLTADGFMKPRCGFFRVGAVKPNIGIEALDLLLDETLVMNDIAMSQILAPDDIFSAVIYPVNDMWLVDGVVSRFDPGAGDNIKAEIIKRAKAAKRDTKKECAYFANDLFAFNARVHELSEQFSLAPT